MSLNNLIDNILQIARNNTISQSEHLSRIQVEKWIVYYRAMLIKQDIDKNRDINDLYISTIEPIHLDAIQNEFGNVSYVGDKELPKLIDFNFRTGLVAVRDMYGNIIQLGSKTKQKYQKYRKYTCKDYIAWLKNNKIYVEGGKNKLEWISVDVIAENPTEAVLCYDPDSDFPVPAAMIPVITQMILEKELRIMTAMPSDDINNSNDDTVNLHKQ